MVVAYEYAAYQLGIRLGVHWTPSPINPVHWLVVGPSGTGKTIFSATLAGRCAFHVPDAKIWIASYVRYITISESDYDIVQNHLRAFLVFPNNDLGLGRTDPDQPPTPRPSLPGWITEAEHLPNNASMPQISDASREAP